MTTCGHSPHHARGLCLVDYDKARLSGTLTNYGRKSVPIEIVIEEIEAGIIRRLADSERIGMKPLSMERALYRAKRNDLVRRLKEEK